MKKASPAIRRFRAVAENLESGELSRELRIRILDGDTEIGGYIRNLPGYSKETFEPFEHEGRWFALYSPDYTTTRVMALPGCTDIGGEEPHTFGFCPVEYFAPRYRPSVVTYRGSFAGSPPQENWLFEADGERSPFETADMIEHIGPWTSLDVAFLAGCQWGDDSSWKVQVIDLAKAATGTIAREERFGHFELPDGRTLCEAITLNHDPPYFHLRAIIERQQHWDVPTGRLLEPYE